MHVYLSRGHIDWNHIGYINIDKVIKERDFVTVDENINNIISYNLENEYDIKILDSNFVKVFQLAQLTVEYLLYCKQYLDQSVIILKDELKVKIEDNHKLRKEVTALEEVIKNLKDKAKERNRIVETKIGDSNGEIHKCPHCPKSFISTMFAKAHVARRHPYITDLSAETSPVHDHYRAETEKLHNEIKMLKERLNQAEKVIRNESDKISSISKIDNKNKENDSNNDNIKYSVNKFELIEKQQIKNNKEINDLKSLLLAEIYNLRQKDESSSKIHDDIPEINVKLLLSQQEKEIARLRNQLLEKLTPDIEKMHDKLKSQEDYWRSKIQHMESQHCMSIEKLTSELNLTQQTAVSMKNEYELKVSALEKQSKNQSSILMEQSKQLSSLSCDMKNSQMQTDLNRYYTDTKIENISTPTVIQCNKSTHYRNTNITDKADVNRIAIENVNSPLKHKLKVEPVLVAPKVSQNYYEEKGSDAFRISQVKNENQINPKSKLLQKYSKNDSCEEHSNTDSLSSISNKNHRASKDLFAAETVSCETSSSVMSTTSESETESDSEIINSKKSFVPLNKKQIISSLSKSTKTSQNNTVLLEEVRKDVLETFQKKLRDIGIDPEWNEIPLVSYKQKVEIIQHHQNINSKKFLKYNEIKHNIIKEILHKISMRCNILHQSGSTKKSSLDKLVTNVKSKAMKAFSIPKSSYVSQKKLRIDLEGEEKNTHDIFKAPRKLSIFPKEKNEHILKNVNEHDVINQNEILPNFINSQKSATSLLDLNVNEGNETQETSSNITKFMNGELCKTSTPNHKNSINFSKLQKITYLIDSPKHNKGALKFATTSAVSLTKKKVLFDLKGDKNKEMSLSQQSELNDSDWNISSISDEKGQILQQRRSRSIDNIVLKTTQTEKIAEISKRIEEQLCISRKKPIGAIEALFPLTCTPENNNKEENQDNKNAQHIDLSSISISNSSLENSSPKFTENFKNNSTKFPLPTPRSIQKKEFNSIDSNLDADIYDILQAE
ncbi:hypothetical protein KPH14_012668 [Odynerus spinipes]|uniref:C2H2-type domain-containing protein n=1 Tax=Odynerus spinipes TaxID=1348599 RepID=A0AAD9RG68_9HYME|nr:hypothetical protein KPH14_012668 [Odynerus spinipes]